MCFQATLAWKPRQTKLELASADLRSPGLSPLNLAGIDSVTAMSPAVVPGVSVSKARIMAVSAGAQHSCYILDTGAIRYGGEGYGTMKCNHGTLVPSALCLRMEPSPEEPECAPSHH